MRVLFLAYGFGDYTTRLANALSDQGVQVQIAIIDAPSSLSDENDFHSPGVNRVLFQKPRLYSPGNLILILRLIRMIRRYNPDLVHSQGMNIWFSLVLPILWLLKYPLIVTLHDPRPHLGESYLRTRLANYLARNYASRVFVHGIRLKELMIQDYRYPEWRICVTPSGEHQVVPFTRYASDDIREEEHTILFFGRIYAYKGLEYLIGAEPSITKEVPDVRIIIAGAGENFEKYRELIVHPDRFTIYNYPIPYEEGARLFQRCSIVVLPYIDASQSGVVHTAYGFRKPVVVTSVGALPEIVDQGVTGYIVPPQDSEALASAVIILLKDVDLRRRMGDQGYNKLKRDLSWSRIVSTIIPVYEQVLQENTSSRNKIHAP